MTVTPAPSPAPPTASVRNVADAPGDVMLLVDGKMVNTDLVEVQRGNHVMIWLRELEKLGWGVVEAGPGNEIRFVGNGVTLAFVKNQGVAKVNSLAVRLPIDVYSKDGKLMVPLSFVAKALGFTFDSMPKTVVTVQTGPAPRVNTITGKVIYDNRGLAGILVRAVDPEFNVVRNVMGKTDAEGKFVLSPLPDGKYMAYVYTGDNPLYFNRASQITDLKEGQDVDAGWIVLGRIIAPLHPKPGSKVSLAKPQIDFSWTSCNGAAKYKLTIKKHDDGSTVLTASPDKPATQVDASKLSAGSQYDVEVTASGQTGDFLGGTAGSGGEPWTFTTTK